MKNERITNWQDAKVFAQMAQIENGREIHDTLVKMAMSKGLDQENSETLTAQIMSGVYAYEDTREKMETNVEAAMEPLFETLSETSLEEQAVALDQILFGFEAMSDDKLFQQAMADSQKAYESNRSGKPECTPEAVETLKAELLKKVGNMNLSPKVLDSMITNLEKTSDYTATAAALGRKGFALKSVTAMLMYLETGESADISESVVTACASVDVQALGDAVNRGLMTRKIARIILYTIGFCVAVFIAIACIKFAIETYVGTVTLLSIFGEANVLRAIWRIISALLLARSVIELDTILEPYIERASDLIGKLTVLLSGMLRRRKENEENRPNIVAYHISEEDRIADTTETDEEPELNWEFYENLDPAF